MARKFATSESSLFGQLQLFPDPASSLQPSLLLPPTGMLAASPTDHMLSNGRFQRLLTSPINTPFGVSRLFTPPMCNKNSHGQDLSICSSSNKTTTTSMDPIINSNANYANGSGAYNGSSCSISMGGVHNCTSTFSNYLGPTSHNRQLPITVPSLQATPPLANCSSGAAQFQAGQIHPHLLLRGLGMPGPGLGLHFARFPPPLPPPSASLQQPPPICDLSDLIGDPNLLQVSLSGFGMGLPNAEALASHEALLRLTGPLVSGENSLSGGPLSQLTGVGLLATPGVSGPATGNLMPPHSTQPPPHPTPSLPPLSLASSVAATLSAAPVTRVIQAHPSPPHPVPAPSLALPLAYPLTLSLTAGLAGLVNAIHSPLATPMPPLPLPPPLSQASVATTSQLSGITRPPQQPTIPGSTLAGGERLIRELVIHNDLIGCIIGRGGTTISEIRSTSGAQIKIANGEEGSRERKITITGTPEAIQMAMILITSRSVSKDISTIFLISCLIYIRKPE
ncbi:unnamed protein product [Protopolystoma xenopodis]|uniref:K Homology domain-containing protein n=1 Tax=Protopolystoma xenopodis TaxID=117903 RepID=A0A448WI72_9PLAT|nr:unnamed protein product [Protopolystoma xenopodis]